MKTSKYSNLPIFRRDQIVKAYLIFLILTSAISIMSNWLDGMSVLGFILALLFKQIFDSKEDVFEEYWESKRFNDFAKVQARLSLDVLSGLPLTISIWSKFAHKYQGFELIIWFGLSAVIVIFLSFIKDYFTESFKLSE